jgi:alcohol dehydrogenase (cytochrome c)
MNRVSRNLLTFVGGIGLAAAAASAMAQAGNEWTVYGGDNANTRYSTLSQINTGNVKQLNVAWIRSLGSLESQESTPLVINGTMFVTTSTGPKYVFALDARNGALKWKYEPELPTD